LAPPETTRNAATVTITLIINSPSNSWYALADASRNRQPSVYLRVDMKMTKRSA
jgi:hypothetical protein